MFSYDTHAWVRRAADISRGLERMVAILAGQYPKIGLLETDTNSGARTEIAIVRIALYAALIAEVLLGVYLLRVFRRMIAR